MTWRTRMGRRGAKAALRHGLDCCWWMVRAHVADAHLLPRGEALEPPPGHVARGLADIAAGHQGPVRTWGGLAPCPIRVPQASAELISWGVTWKSTNRN